MQKQFEQPVRFVTDTDSNIITYFLRITIFFCKKVEAYANDFQKICVFRKLFPHHPLTPHINRAKMLSILERNRMKSCSSAISSLHIPTTITFLQFVLRVMVIVLRNYS